MSRQSAEAEQGDLLDRNEVALVGRLSSEPEQRILPSGDTVWVFRVVVRRPADGASRQSVDTLDCCAWSPKTQRLVGRWRVGDQVELEGAVRRRFFRAGGAAASRVEIEMTSGRLRRRADAA